MVDVLRSQILLVDDHPLFRAGLAMALSVEPDLQVVGEASTAEEAVRCVREQTVDLAVTDVLMPTTTGISLASHLIEVNPRLKILGLSVLDEPMIIASMLRAGALGYVLKTQPPEEVTLAIRTVLAGSRYIPPRVSQPAVTALVGGQGEQPLHRLTRREREIFDLLIRGHSNEEIGGRLFIARRTVETHRQRIMKKLATHSILDMIRVAAQQGALSE
jgi:DNA-binding NarL/FixJ family response regulator